MPDEIKDKTLAYLVVVLENRSDDRLEEDTGELAELVTELGALDVYVLPRASGAALIEAREKAFWNAKASGADDILDMVVPRAAIPLYLAKVQELAQAHRVAHRRLRPRRRRQRAPLGVPARPRRAHARWCGDLFAAGVALGGAISGEHGIGTEKKKYLADLEDPPSSPSCAASRRRSTPPASSTPARSSTDDRKACMNGAHALIRTLVDAGVDVCFMNPGTSEMHFVAALDDVPEMRGVLALFEGVATGAADGYARMAGQPGGRRCSTSAPGSATASPTCTTPARRARRS